LSFESPFDCGGQTVELATHGSFNIYGLPTFLKIILEIVVGCGRVKGSQVLPKRWIAERAFDWFSKPRWLCRDYEVRLDHSEAMIRIYTIRLMVKRSAKQL